MSETDYTLTFVWLSTVFFFFLGVIWKKNTLLNVTLKVLCCLLAFIGALIISKVVT